MHIPALFLQIFSVIHVLAADLVPKATESAQAAIDTCNALDAALGSMIVQSSGIEYEEGATGAWNLYNTESRPTCIVFPRNERHVQVAMREIFHAKSHYAVQASGHSAMKGWNTVQNGVLILFRHMKNVTFNRRTDTITLDPGVRWGEALSALEPHGVAPVGGRQSDVGTGLLLGGGLSFLSPAHGFAADNYKKLNVVLVNGDLVTATATNEYADIFRALKGGANRFGIVTRYELYAIHTGTKDDKTWFGGSITYSGAAAEALLTATAHYVQDVKDPKAVLLVAIVDVMTAGLITQSILVNMFYNGTELPPSIFGEFLAIPALLTDLGPLSYYDVANTLPSGNNSGNGELFGASALIGDATLYLNAYKHWTNFSQTMKDEVTSTVLAFTPVLQPQIEIGRARGGNAISPPDGGYAVIGLAEQFPPGDLSVPANVEAAIQLLFEQIRPSPGKPLFMNECNARQNVFETYGDYEFIKQTYAKYDPSGFNVKYTDGPLGLA